MTFLSGSHRECRPPTIDNDPSNQRIQHFPSPYCNKNRSSYGEYVGKDNNFRTFFERPRSSEALVKTKHGHPRWPPPGMMSCVTSLCKWLIGMRCTPVVPRLRSARRIRRVEYKNTVYHGILMACIAVGTCTWRRKEL